MPDPRTATLGDLAKSGYLEIGDGYRTKRSEHGTPGLPILRVAEVQDGRIEPEFADFVSERYRSAMGPKVSRPGDVILTTKGTVGRAAIMPADSRSFVYSPQVCYFRAHSDGPLAGHYLYYWFKSDGFWSQARSLKGQTDMADYINLADIRSLEISMPAKQTQHAIVKVLSALDDKIGVNDRIIGTYEQLLRVRFEELRIDENPEHLPAGQVSDFIEFNPALRTPRGSEAVYLDMAAVPTDRAMVREWSRREPKSGTRFTNGDTVMARITPCLENGKTAFIDFMEDGEVGIGSTEFIVMRARQDIPEHLPYFLARSPRFRGYAVQNMVGSSGRQRVNAGQLTDFPLRRPDSVKLAAFGALASKAFAHMRLLTYESGTLAELRDTLLPRLMSGEIRVREAEKAAEEVT